MINREHLPPAQDRDGTPVPMEEGEIDSGTDQDPSVLEVPATNWARYFGFKSVQYCKNGTRTENNSRRQKLGFRAGGKRNRKKLLNRPSASHD